MIQGHCPTPWKKPWRDEAEARQQLKHTKKESRQNKKLAARLGVYFCECGFWHIGHNVKANARALRQRIYARIHA